MTVDLERFLKAKRFLTDFDFDEGVGEVKVKPASLTVQGKIELATALEALAGIDAVRAITPATLALVIDDFASTLVDIYVTGVNSYNATTHVLTLNMSNGSTVDLSMVGVVNDAVNSVPPVPAASTVVAGKTRYATNAETATGTVTDAATTPAAVKSVLDPVKASLATLETDVTDSKRTWLTGVGGTANAITATLSPLPTALKAGQTFRFVALYNNTGPATLTIGALPTIPIVNSPAVALTNGIIKLGAVVQVTYDGTNFQLISGGGAAVTSTFTVEEFVPSAGVTTLTPAGGYTPGQVMLQRNGALLSPSDYVATNGTTITIPITVAGTTFALWKFAVGDMVNYVTSLMIQRQLYTAFPATQTVAGAYSVSPSPAITLVANTQLRVTFNVTRLTGASTLEATLTAPTGIKQRDKSGAKIDPVIVAGVLYNLEYDGTHWMILNPLPNINAGEAALLGGATPNVFTIVNTPKGVATPVSTTSSVVYDPSTHGQVAQFDVTNAITVTFSAPTGIVQFTPYTILIRAGDVSARSFVWNSAFKFPGGVAPITSGTITTGSYDTISFIGGSGNTLIHVGSQADVR